MNHPNETATEAERRAFEMRFVPALEKAREWITDPRNARTRAAIPLRSFLKAVDQGQLAGPSDLVAVPFVVHVSPGRTGQTMDWREAWKNPSILWDLDGVIEKLANAQAAANLPYKSSLKYSLPL